MHEKVRSCRKRTVNSNMKFKNLILVSGLALISCSGYDIVHSKLNSSETNDLELQCASLYDKQELKSVCITDKYDKAYACYGIDNGKMAEFMKFYHGDKISDERLRQLTSFCLTRQ